MMPKRSLKAADHPSRVGAHGTAQCRWCRKPVQPPRKSWCSEDCIHEYRIRSDPGYLRAVVFQRDKGVCRRCGRDISALHKELSELLEHERAARCKALDIPWSRGRRGGSLYDADHVVPVAEGGDATLPSPQYLANVVTLCVPCHRKKTYKTNQD